jgi:cytochrome c oxidase cbb3-type subunit 3
MSLRLSSRRIRFLRAPLVLGLAALLLGHAATAQPRRTQDLSQAPAPPPATGPETMLQVPVTNLLPGGATRRPQIASPTVGDAAAIERGHKYFSQFNCVSCHGDNGGGGMGPPLSDEVWLYGADPENVYLTIRQGRPNGMPSFGSILPDPVIWDLVAYVGIIWKKPDGTFGRTTSLSPPSPAIEQVPAEMLTTSHPWDHTEPFAMGQKPQSDLAAQRIEQQKSAAPTAGGAGK